LLYLSEEPPLGFGYPFGGVKPSHPWKSLSTSSAHGLPSSEFFSSRDIESFFRITLPFLLFTPKPFGFVMELQRVKLPEKPFPTLCSPTG
jgi:hypothetical protein